MRSSLLFTAIAFAAAVPASALADTPATKPAITDYAERLMATNYRQDAPGAAVPVARGDEVIFRGARGLAEVETGAPLTANSVSRIGSVGKQDAILQRRRAARYGRRAIPGTVADRAAGGDSATQGNRSGTWYVCRR